MEEDIIKNVCLLRKSGATGKYGDFLYFVFGYVFICRPRILCNLLALVNRFTSTLGRYKRFKGEFVFMFV